MKLSDFKTLTSVTIFILIFCMWVCVIKFLHASYMFVMDNISFIKVMWDYEFIKINYQHIIDLFMDWLPILGTYLLVLLGLKVALFLFRRVVIPTSWIGKWQRNAEISPVLGRYFVRHYRNNIYLNVMDFRNYLFYAKTENNFVSYHSRNDNLKELFEAHDINWKKDKDIINEQKTK